MRSRSTILSFPANGRRWDPWAITASVRAAVRMAGRQGIWVRQPETWTPSGANASLQFRSLVTHLFETYPIPNSIKRIWTQDYIPTWQMGLFLQLSAGKSIRKIPLPMSFEVNKNVAGWFMQCPDDLGLSESFRWAQVRAECGDEKLARILSTRTILSSMRNDERFWQSVIRFLIKHQPISEEETISIVDFLDQQKFQPGCRVFGPDAGQEPLQPDFSINGRSLMSLRRLMANWREQIVIRFPPDIPKHVRWEPTNIEPLRCRDGEKVWLIEEILTGKDLRIEGHAMQHCVADYESDCVDRSTSIWSMKSLLHRRWKREATIELIPGDRRVIQARARCNASPSRKALRMLQQWAENSGLKLELEEE